LISCRLILFILTVPPFQIIIPYKELNSAPELKNRFVLDALTSHCESNYNCVISAYRSRLSPCHFSMFVIVAASKIIGFIIGFRQVKLLCLTSK
jgi:hypothetical protein